MILTFTGTQQGMTSAQATAIKKLLWIMGEKHLEQINHGGCVGADTEFHAICDGLNLLPLVMVWPSNIKHKQGKLIGKGFQTQQVERDPLERNRLMVYNSTHLLATPKEYEEVLRSGTWATIRAAWKQRLVTTIILPDGRFF